MLPTLLKARFPTVSLGLGVLLVVASFFKIDDITKMQMSAHSSPIYPVFACGIVLIVAAVAVVLLTAAPLELRINSKIKRTKSGFTLRIGSADFNISFGRIENWECSDRSCAIALPANEFFDDECINDRDSALGAYIQSKFPGKIDDILKLISQRLEGLPSEQIEKEPGKLDESYDIGTCVYLDRPLSVDKRIILASATTKRAGQGLRAEPLFVFIAMKSVLQVMADHRITELYLPLIGAGRGGMPSAIALLYLALAVSELLRSSLGYHLRSINTMVFQKDRNTAPEVSRRTVRRILAFVDSVVCEQM